MNEKSIRHNYLLQPAIALFDIVVIIVSAFLLHLPTHAFLIFAVYSVFGWLITTVGFGFYKVYRFTPLVRILGLISRQLFLVLLCTLSFFGIFNEIDIALIDILNYLSVSMISIALFKILVFNLRKKFRTRLGADYVRVVIIGRNAKTEKLKDFFNYNRAYGFKMLQNFDLKNEQISLNEIQNYVLENTIEEVFCSISELNNAEIKQLIDFADNHLVKVKFLPDNKDIFTKKMDFQYYGYTPILALRTLSLDSPINMFLKRLLDVLISVLVVVGVLSWLTPLLAIIINLDNKGPLFFKQLRTGLDGKEFYCYKFRSMAVNSDANKQQARRDDRRTTRVGRFLRRTSLDEFPQFYNVLMGNMSVVGPRPHMLSHTIDFASQIDKFMLRHLVKPGITGLAQISGYRGEIETKHDIKNRVRLDIFYVENWSILMDLRIIAKTFLQVIYGDKKAY
ncbi:MULTISPECIES: exopolysaccharide biosynthesis polyprenyl glycosylphosphotransferase [unclassified Leeuwenhoekiella]|uniref:exopolysaccharide biosynthesis polyprenyl glycosylphosphotransferase n=1 Tax=unclassified Leeuwenhoekiella TaxID=2615029 RepID=UPI000C4B1BC1|nr:MULTISPECIES: exopolysaccharide biosynthesis polyprenyl glycosylphosphotransferase [unclassified Leeuwenhoekiella]MAW96013.1 undecaprenyl-phosphate glucose phosphotransferase [Leeuwenhoekiella sp.]MBA80007.1 undecaprenyl-phosphate glucose phosphotransferase [Leeuwenhoekiella sp.]|tara:strand:+ start:9529 stop:10881 length:1353 start_codon:yes stop_codon:yes gene_type:complete